VWEERVPDVTDAPDRAERADAVVPDLVAYLIVAVPSLDSLASLVPALTAMAKTGAIRIIDLVAVRRMADGALEILEFEEVRSLATLADVEGQVGRLLSSKDIEMASVVFRPDSAGIILVTEDRWAEPLSRAARQAGGRIVAGERIPASRVEEVLADTADEDLRGA
jgi:hypothetical protein